MHAEPIACHISCTKDSICWLALIRAQGGQPEYNAHKIIPFNRNYKGYSIINKHCHFSVREKERLVKLNMFYETSVGKPQPYA